MPASPNYLAAARNVHGLAFAAGHPSGKRFVLCGCGWASLEDGPAGSISHDAHVREEADRLRELIDGRT